MYTASNDVIVGVVGIGTMPPRRFGNLGGNTLHRNNIALIQNIYMCTTQILHYNEPSQQANQAVIQSTNQTATNKRRRKKTNSQEIGFNNKWRSAYG